MKNEKQKLGKWGEILAEKYLSSNGFTILARNYHTPHGELDIIAIKNGLLLFVEVKTRSSHKYLYPEESVTKRKQANMMAAAERFMEFYVGDLDAWQFDVIAVERNNDNKIIIEHFENIIQ